MKKACTDCKIENSSYNVKCPLCSAIFSGTYAQYMVQAADHFIKVHKK